MFQGSLNESRRTPVEKVPHSRLKAEANYLEWDTTGFSRADLVNKMHCEGIYNIDLRWPAKPKPLDISSRIDDPSNIFIGDGAGLHEKGNNKLYIANNSTETPLIGGDFIKKKVTLHECLTLDQSDIGPEIIGEEGDLRRMQSELYMYRKTNVHPGWYPVIFGPVVIV